MDMPPGVTEAAQGSEGGRTTPLMEERGLSECHLTPIWVTGLMERNAAALPRQSHNSFTSRLSAV